ncbi:MAG TPA: aldo/keto reductase [Anaeromyxobacteraceae bacterium]|nr:aldo/keto reductase [Anaeromyxobacteraceae bacterium]
MQTRIVPRTGEPLPCVGLGTWNAFDVASAGDRPPRAEVLRVLFEAGGRVIDSSPMYGRAEQVVGDLLRAGPHPAPFLATKVWTTGRAEGVAQMEESIRRMAAPGRIDLMQVHNLLDVDTHLATLRRWKEEGRIRYAGVTHYARSAFGALEQLVRGGQVDFVQLPYSAASREAEARLLPAAADNRVAVLVMRPFEEGGLLRLVRGRPLPGWAAEAGIATWPELFLRWILGHPAVTCPIPATSNPSHARENVRAGEGPALDPAQRRRLVSELGL